MLSQCVTQHHVIGQRRTPTGSAGCRVHGAVATRAVQGFASPAVALRRGGPRRLVRCREQFAVRATAVPVPNDTAEQSRQALKDIRAEALAGTVVAALDGMAAVDGFGADVPLGVRVTFDGGAQGLLLNRNQGYSFVLLIGNATVSRGAAAQVERSFAVVPPSDELLGRTLDWSELVSFVKRDELTWCG